jgi:hypothetical protein
MGIVMAERECKAEDECAWSQEQEKKVERGILELEGEFWVWRCSEHKPDRTR